MPNMLNGAEFIGAPNYVQRVQMLEEIRTDMGLSVLPPTVTVVPANGTQRCSECWSPNTRNAIAHVQVESLYPAFLCGAHLRNVLLTYGGEFRCVQDGCTRAWVRRTHQRPSFSIQGHEGNEEAAICSDHEPYFRPCEECGKWYQRGTQQPCCEPSPRCSCCSENERQSGQPMVPIGAVMVCHRCAPRYYPECAECGVRHYYDTMGRIYDPSGSYRSTVQRVCNSCANVMVDGVPTWHHCSQHGVVCRLNGLTYDRAVELVDTSDSILCCDGSSAEIHSYSYRPNLMFKGTGPMFYGAEIEVTARDLDRAARIANRDFKGHVYLKTDGSISGSGFEMVTHPASYEWWMTDFQWTVLDKLKAAGASAHSSCGIHVHASRDGFGGPGHEYRWLTFFDRNRTHIEKVARRRDSRWASFGNTTPKQKLAEAKRDPYRRSGNRYSSINVTNTHTYEVRIFATSLEVQQVQAAIGLVSATVEYTRNLSTATVMKLGGLDWSAFRNWVADDPQYAPLSAEITRVGA